MKCNRNDNINEVLTDMNLASIVAGLTKFAPPPGMGHQNVIQKAEEEVRQEAAFIAELRRSLGFGIETF